MKRLSMVITDLIILAQQVISAPRLNNYQGLAEIAAEVRRADALPAEYVRSTRAALMLVMAIEEHRHCNANRSRELEPQWLMIVGVLLPLVRAECWTAVTNEREQAK